MRSKTKPKNVCKCIVGLNMHIMVERETFICKTFKLRTQLSLIYGKYLNFIKNYMQLKI